MRYTPCRRAASSTCLALFAWGALVLPGCENKPADQPPPATDAAVDQADDDPLAGLSAEDRAAVLAQKICPVAGEPLGSMGTPIKVTIDGRDVFVCCKGCIEALEADPAKYLAVLDGADSLEDAEAGAAQTDAEDAADN